MNILVIEDSSKVRFGGGQRVTEWVVSLLSERYKVFMVDFVSSSELEARVKGNVEGFLHLKTGGRITGVKSSYSLGCGELFSLPWFLAFNMVKLRRWCRERFDRKVVVYCATKKALLYGIALKLTAGYRLVYHCHTASPPKTRLARILNWLASTYCDRIIVVSRFVQREFHNLSNTDLIYNAARAGVECVTEGRALKETTTVGFVGNLLPGKGFEVFAKVAEEMSRGYKRYLFRAYGDNPNRVPISSAVDYRGFCERETIYRETDILLFCSTVPEACPLAPMEAQAWGIPVVAPNLGALPEIIQDGVSGILYESPIEISAALERLSHRDIYEAFSRRSIESVTRFSGNIFQRKIEGVFRDLEEGRG